MKKFRGNITALVTPFKQGEIDYLSLEKLIKFQIKKESHGLVICGTTGEGPSLQIEEYDSLLKNSYNFNNKEIDLIAGVITNNLQQAISMAKIAESNKLDGILVSVPFYIKPSQSGIFEYYKKIRESCNLPIILYDNPSRSGVSASDNIVIELANQGIIHGIKDASGDLSRLLVMKSNIKQDNFSFLCGNDDLSVAYNSYGGDGCISAVANLAPSLCAKMQEYCFAENYQKALSLQSQLIKLIKLCFSEPSPGPIKAGLASLELCENELRLPMQVASIQLADLMKKEMKNLGLL